MQRNTVCASEVLSTKDMNMRPSQDLCEIIGRFLRGLCALVESRTTACAACALWANDRNRAWCVPAARGGRKA
jgi:hypothetical protein